eukprot:4852900-Ditylum_brightwellii.AAC.1
MDEDEQEPGGNDKSSSPNKDNEKDALDSNPTKVPLTENKDSDELSSIPPQEPETPKLQQSYSDRVKTGKTLTQSGLQRTT